MKTCTKCKTEQPLDCFKLVKGKPVAQCKGCLKELRRISYENNKEKVAEQGRAWRSANKDRKRQKDKEYAAKNPDIFVRARLKYLAKNAERQKENCKRWDVENKERRLQIGRNWQKNNPDAVRLKAANRRAKKDCATPSWLSDFDKLKMKCTYQVAAMRTHESGQEWHVDHIIPLRGKLVSGLHVPWNLQVITKEENLKKLNRFEVA